ncbi:MAG TPA: Ig-like domain-containing protein [Allosphingosinicella sp.]
MTIHTGTSGNDYIDGGNGTDSIYGLGGDDVILGGNGADAMLDGGAGNDQLFGENGNDHLVGGEGDDLIDGNNGFDVAYYSGLIQEYSFLASAGYLHIRHLGGAGPDGHDRVIRVERLVFGDRVIDLGSGKNAPVALDDFVLITEDVGTHNSGAPGVLANDFDFDGDAMTVAGGVFAGAYGTLTLNSNGTYSYAPSAAAQALGLGESAQDSFTYTVSDNDGSDTGQLVFTITGVNDAPSANPDFAATGENEVALIDVLANDQDVDNGAFLTVTAASAPAGKGTASVVGNQVQYDPGGNFEALAAGESEDVVVGYDIVDEHGATASSTVTVTVNGANDGPAANPDTFATGENGVVLIDATANDTDVDNGAVLTVAAASAPAGKGSASAAGDQVRFDPGTDFDDLALGDSEEVAVAYTVQDEHGATSSSTVTITVVGANDGPVANPDSRTTSESSAVVIDVIANDVDVDREAVLVVTAASAPAGQGIVTIFENEVRFDPGGDFDHLASGENAEVVISYTIQDEHGASASSTVTVTVRGLDSGGGNTGTEDGDILVGTPGDDTIDALGGDDSVYGLAGEDLLFGGDGSDFLSGGEDDDVLEGGNGGDNLSGGDGDDELVGDAGNDTLAGNNGNDRLSGGDGLDSLAGGDGDDVIEGGADDDFLFGEEGDDELLGQAGSDLLFGGAGNDQLTGGAGNDSLGGSGGDDVLEGGDGDDVLSGGVGSNVLNGGLGADTIFADSTEAAQTVDGGDGNDTIRHAYRSSASTITLGAGSDSVEFLHANVGTAVIVVADFTAGSGGDQIRLSGQEGSLLGLLAGWDGTSNPFSSGFLRLRQDGTGTLLEWDQDGEGTSSDWETLAVFENTDAGDFTAANFHPGYDPAGAPPAGETITGTTGDDVLIGSDGPDTINALAGNDFIIGGAGADLMRGGDGFDQLSGGAGNDVGEGGNDDDLVSGGDGNDNLSGQAGNDELGGDNGDDSLSGGDGDDVLYAGDGDDMLNGGNGQDYLLGSLGLDVMTGGAEADLFDFQSSSEGPDVITDFAGGSDRIRIWESGFGGGLTPGAPVSLVSGSDPVASGASGQFLYDTDDGSLFWDADGTGSGEAVLIATFTNLPSLEASDFFVI